MTTLRMPRTDDAAHADNAAHADEAAHTDDAVHTDDAAYADDEPDDHANSAPKENVPIFN